MSGPPALILDGEAANTLAPLLALRLLVWEQLPAGAAQEFDAVAYGVNSVIGELRSRDTVEVERNIAVSLDRIDAGARACDSSLRKKGEGKAADALAAAVASLTLAARDHLERVRLRAKVRAGLNPIVDLLPEEYLIQCALCGHTAERLRLRSDSVSFTRCTGAVSALSLPRASAQELFAVLEEKGAAALCERVENRRKGNVLGYCPDCRALYCPEHYQTVENWSGSWLEALNGKCVNGHRREVA